jgi:V8-like Glu-specific endopeptidase
MRARPGVEGLETRATPSLTPVAAGSGMPYSAIVKLEMTFPDGEEMVGSGSLIDADHVLTAGHVVYSSEHGGWATSITVIPELNGTSEPFGSATSTYVRTFDTWINYDRANPGETSPDAMDIGLITLDVAIGEKTGWMSYGYASSNGAFSSGTTFASAGYPASGGYDGLNMQYTSGRVDGLSANGGGILYHNPNITVFGGQSGSPLWSTSTGVVYGVVVADSFAIRITKSIYDQIESWRNSDAPAPSPPVYAPPTILNQSFRVSAGSSLLLTTAQLLAGAVDPEGLTLTPTVVTKPSHGTLTRNPITGAYIYRPYSTYSGRDSFTIQASDGKQVSNTATITLNVAGDPPTLPKGSSMLVTLDNGILYQYDSDGSRQLARGVKTAGGGLTPAGDLVYTVVFADGSLYQYDAAGVRFLAGNVQSATMAYPPSGAPTYLVVFTDGSLYQYDAAGVRMLAGGVSWANAAYSAAGSLVYQIVFADGSLYQYDDDGVHFVLDGVASANMANTYFSPSSTSAARTSTARASASAASTAASTPGSEVEERKPAASAPVPRRAPPPGWGRRATRVAWACVYLEALRPAPLAGEGIA